MDGALVGGRCYASQDDAADAFYSAAAPAQTPGGTTYLSEFVKVAGQWKLRRYQVDSSGGVATLSDAVLPVTTFVACDPAGDFKDGLQVGGGVVAAMAVAWALMVVRRGL